MVLSKEETEFGEERLTMEAEFEETGRRCGSPSAAVAYMPERPAGSSSVCIICKILEEMSKNVRENLARATATALRTTRN